MATRALQALGACAMLPLLAFCSSGEISAPAAEATPLAAPVAGAAPVAVAPEDVVTGPAPIWINEVLAHTDEPQVDTLELYNPGTTAVDLTGWCISDDKDDPAKYCIPPAAGANALPVIPGQGFFLVTAPELGFAFSEFGEDVILSAPNGGGLQQIDRVEFGVSPNGVSLGRYVTSTGAVHFPLQRALTLGRANAGPLISPVVISEIAYDPNQGPEYLVLANSGDQPAQLYDPAVPDNSWRVTNIDNNNGAYKLPPQTTLQPGERIVLTADPAAFAAAHPTIGVRVLGPFNGKLNNDGERIALEAPQPPEQDTSKVYYAETDAVQYGVTAPWPAAGQNGDAIVRKDLRAYGDDPANWQAAPAGLKPQSVVLLPLVKR
jgi:hypothetical protein